jgi:hypothetical protein
VPPVSIHSASEKKWMESRVVAHPLSSDPMLS